MMCFKHSRGPDQRRQRHDPRPQDILGGSGLAYVVFDLRARCQMHLNVTMEARISAGICCLLHARTAMYRHTQAMYVHRHTHKPCAQTRSAHYCCTCKATRRNLCRKSNVSFCGVARERLPHKRISAHSYAAVPAEARHVQGAC